MEFPVKGACQCGQVSYELYQAPKIVIACHCVECQKLSTGPFSVTAMVSAEDITFTGELSEWQRMADSGNKNSAKFCPSCGNRIYHYNPDDAAILKLKLKPVNLEDDSLFEPTAHVWVDSKVGWYDIPEGVKCFPANPKI